MPHPLLILSAALGLSTCFPSVAAALINVGTLDTPGSARDVEVVCGLAYVADGSSGLRIIDISNPAAPVELGALDTPGFAYDVEVVGPLAYVADGSSGLRMIDVSNPATPVELGALNTPLVFGAILGIDIHVGDVSGTAIVGTHPVHLRHLRLNQLGLTMPVEQLRPEHFHILRQRLGGVLLVNPAGVAHGAEVLDLAPLDDSQIILL